MVEAAVGLVVFVAGWLLLRGGGAAPGSRLASSEEREALAADEAARQRDYGPRSMRGIESGFAGAAAGLGAGLAIGAAFGAGAGPVGAAIGAFVGFFVAAIMEAIETESYGEAVRAGVADWLRAGGVPHDAAAVDALLFREALLGASFVWHNARTGAVGVEVTEKREHRPLDGRLYDRILSVSLLPTERQAQVIPGNAARDLGEAIVGWSYGRLDGPSQRRTRRAWEDRARVGQMYLIGYQPARRSWRDRSHLLAAPWFQKVWPTLAMTPTVRRGEGWARVVPSPANVDLLAAGFDRAAGVVWRIV